MDPQLITFISPRVGEWIIVKKFQQEKRAILYDPTSIDPAKHPSSLIILGWPYGRATPKLKFTEIITDVTAAKSATISKGPDAGKKKYISIQEFVDSNIAIGTREERVMTIKQIENHPAVVKVTTSDGVNLEIIIAVTVEVYDPMPALKIDDFLGYAATFVTEAYRLWAAGKTFRENRAVNTNDNKAIDDEVCDRIDRLNTEKFNPEQFNVNHIAVVQISVAKGSEEAQESERQILIASNQNEESKFTQQRQLRENETKEKQNATALAFYAGKKDADAKYVADTSKNIALQNKAWGDGGLKTLIMNDPKSGSGPVQTISVADVA